MNHIPSVILVAASVLTASSLSANDTADSPTPAKVEFFEAKIRPVLVEHCYQCHNSTRKAQGGLAVDSRAAFLKGGDGGVVLIAGKPDKSRLLAILRHEVDGLEMPKQGPKLDKQVVADFQKWIADGAVDPRDTPPSASDLAKAMSWETQLQKRKQWWSFQPISKRPPPTVVDNRWSEHPIDRFVLTKLREKHLEPNQTADSRTLVRRIYFALLGLPPTPQEVEECLQDVALVRRPSGSMLPANNAALLSSQSAIRNPQSTILRGSAIERLVDRLLASPHFGERWARHWMDWIRYAESHGSEGDPEIVNAWQYRDYLIRALNADVPFDQLVREHVAGDLLAKPRINKELGINESAIGPAHWRMVFHGFGPTDPLEEKSRYVDDQINAFSKAFLGLTVSCAKCHDHKFDAIGQRDYYSLFGILSSCRPSRVTIDLPEKLDRNRDLLFALKPKIKTAIADEWTRSGSIVRARLLASVGKFTDDGKTPSLLQPLVKLRHPSNDKATFAERWKLRVDDWKAARSRREMQSRQGYPKRWDLTDAAEYSKWTRYGTGLTNRPSTAGEFAISVAGDKVLSGIYPSGVYSHGISAKHAARLTSRDIYLGEDFDLWLRVIGDGGAIARYVVRDYPRDGTIYPIARLSPQWRWQKFDMTYWTGDDIHLELAAGQDEPLMANNEPRSWFGVREAVLMKKGSPSPIDANDGLDRVIAVAAESPPGNLEQLVDVYVRAILVAADAWRAGTCDDVDATLLGACIEIGLLPNNPQELLAVQPLLAEYRRLEAEIAVPTRVPGMEETVGRKQYVFERGNHKKLGVETPPRFLEAIDSSPYPVDGKARLRLAEDLLRDDNPLTRRVIVNRVWHHLFGRGIVPTPDNFGRLGLEPTHPELLDYLANRFTEHGWSIKELIRFIVLSKTWQLDSRPSDDAARVDPENRLLSHAILRRLEAEAIRDSLLAVSGDLSREQFGPPVNGDSNRRSVYVHVRRNALDPFLRAFDFPEPFSATGRRDVTNVPAQSLTMMNDPRIAALADHWAARVLADTSASSDEARVQRMVFAAFGRQATAAEVTACKAQLAASNSTSPDRKAQWSDLARSLFLCKEFVYIQ